MSKYSRLLQALKQDPLAWSHCSPTVNNQVFKESVVTKLLVLTRQARSPRLWKTTCWSQHFIKTDLSLSIPKLSESDLKPTDYKWVSIRWVYCVQETTLWGYVCKSHNVNKWDGEADMGFPWRGLEWYCSRHERGIQHRSCSVLHWVLQDSTWFRSPDHPQKDPMGSLNLWHLDMVAMDAMLFCSSLYIQVDDHWAHSCSYLRLWSLSSNKNLSLVSAQGTRKATYSRIFTFG